MSGQRAPYAEINGHISVPRCNVLEKDRYCRVLITNPHEFQPRYMEGTGEGSSSAATSPSLEIYDDDYDDALFFYIMRVQWFKIRYRLLKLFIYIYIY